MTRRVRLFLRRAALVLVALIASWSAACDDDGGEVTGPRETPNRSPVAVGEIAAQTAFLGDTIAVDVSSAFRDPDGDPLTFMAASSEPAVVAVSTVGSEVTAVGVSRGRATVTVTARDPDGGEARQSFGVEVPNRGPMVVGRIEPQTVFLGETATVDASPAFSDPDGDELSFAAASSDTASVLASVTGGEVRLEAVKRGTATVTVTARDADSLAATLSFEVAVPNRPPAAVGEIEPQTVFLGGTATVDVSAAFADRDGDTLHFEAASSEPAVVAVSTVGSEVTAVGVSRGRATVTVTARDPDGGEARQSFGVEVPNRGPMVVGRIEPQTVFLGETATVDASPAFSDPDGDELSFAAASSDTASVLASVTGGEVRLEAVKRGTATVTVTARDADSLAATLSFEVAVPNRPPAAVGEIEPQTVFLGGTATVDVSAAFADRDGDTLHFEAASSEPAVVAVSTVGSEVTAVGVSRGRATVTVTARDPDGGEARQSFGVEVPNRGPMVVGRIEPQTVFLGETATVDASPAFSDPDGDELSFAAASSDTASVLASVTGGEVRLEAVKRGTATVTVTARDADSLAATLSFEVAVPNRPPAAVGEIEPQTVFLGGTATVDVSAAFADRDGDTLHFEAASSEPAVVAVSTVGSEVTAVGVSRGRATVTVTARDPDGGEARQSFGVEVPNRGPMVAGTIPAQTVDEGATTTVDAASYFSDPDGDELDFGASSSNPAVAGASVSGSRVTIDGVTVGSASVTVTARDPDGAEGRQSFGVTVWRPPPPNQAPVVSSAVPAQTVTENESVSVDLDGHFRDPEGGSLDYGATSSDEGVATADISGSVLAVRGVSEGRATVTVTATDAGGLSADHAFGVIVRPPPPPNQAPVVSSAVPAQTVTENESVSVDLDGHFRDPEGGSLDYGATSSDEGVATADISGSVLAVRGVSEGRATVTVTATDAGGLSADHAFGVIVRPPPPPNQAPVVSSAVPAQTVTENESVSVDLDGHFRDPEGGSLDYGATSSDEGVATADISGSVLAVRGVSEGRATVTVTATDAGGLSADHAFGVIVRPPPPPNQAPVVSSAVPAQTVTENESVSVDLDGHFRDPEGGSLDYGATSSDEGVATADISGSVLAVRGVSEGRATVTVTATDAGGLSTRQSFGVTVEPAGSTNQAPVVTSTIADRTAIRGGELPLQAYRYFSDPDDDELSYRVGTSNLAVAFVRIASPAVFYVTAVSDGEAEIRVEAKDPGGLTASTSFTFAVGNNAPRVKTEAPAVTSSPGQTDWLVLSDYFEETDVGDQLNFSASSNNSGVASVSIQFHAIYGYQAKVGGVTPGEATIDMTATDRGGLTASTSSLVTVTANRPPQVTQSIGNQSLAVNDTLTWDLSHHFSDPDNDALTYTAAGGFAVTVSVSGATFQLVGATAGVSPVRVTATDPAGRTAEITFLASVSASQSIEGLASSNPRRRPRITLRHAPADGGGSLRAGVDAFGARWVRWTEAVAKDRAVLGGVPRSGHGRADDVFLLVSADRLVTLGLDESPEPLDSWAAPRRSGRCGGSPRPCRTPHVAIDAVTPSGGVCGGSESTVSGRGSA